MNEFDSTGSNTAEYPERRSRPQRRPLDELTLSVVLPVYNERTVLPTLLERVVAAVEPLVGRMEVIFVNDGSRDGSGQVLDDLASRRDDVRVLHFTRNFGHQAAVQAGLTTATGDVVVLMDSDLQDDPAAVAGMLARWQAGYDVVYATRMKRKENPLKRLLFASFHRLLAAISSTPIPTDAGNFSLMDRRVVDQIVHLGERDRYLPGLRAWVGFRQTGIAVERGARYDLRPRVSLRGLWQLAKTAIFSFSSMPLKFFSLIGYGALVVFFGVAAFSLYFKLFTTLAIPGWTSYVLIASFFGAVNALGIAVLGEYVVRIYDQVRQRPLYLVDRAVNVAPWYDSPPPSYEAPQRDASADSFSGNALEAYSALLDEAQELLSQGGMNEDAAASIGPKRGIPLNIVRPGDGDEEGT